MSAKAGTMSKRKRGAAAAARRDEIGVDDDASADYVPESDEDGESKGEAEADGKRVKSRRVSLSKAGEAQLRLFGGGRSGVEVASPAEAAANAAAAAAKPVARRPGRPSRAAAAAAAAAAASAEAEGKAEAAAPQEDLYPMSGPFDDAANEALWAVTQRPVLPQRLVADGLCMCRHFCALALSRKKWCASFVTGSSPTTPETCGVTSTACIQRWRLRAMIRNRVFRLPSLVTAIHAPTCLHSAKSSVTSVH